MKNNRYAELLELVQSFEPDFKKFYEKENREAGIRLRKHMQELREFAQKMRANLLLREARLQKAL